MTWPDRVQQIVNTLAAGVAHDAPDELRRATTMKIAQQCRYELGPNWGTKRADPGRPLSADVICTQSPFVGWDWSVPTGIAQFPDSLDLTGQVFVLVEAVDHLGVGQPPVPPPERDDIVRLTALVRAITIEVQLLRVAVRDVHARL